MLRKSNDNPPFIKVYHPCKRDYHNPYQIVIETKWCKTIEEAVELWNRRA